MVQLSHPYMTAGKTIALTRWTFVGKVMSLLSNMLSRLVLIFLPRSKFHGCNQHLQWFGAPQNKVWHCFHCFPIYFSRSDGTRCHDLSFWMLSFKPTFSLSSFSFITSWQIDGETMETVTVFIFWAPKSLQMVTATVKLKDACPLEEELWQP